jgi:hypothetical protein
LAAYVRAIQPETTSVRQLTCLRKNTLEWWNIPACPEAALVRPFSAARCDGVPMHHTSLSETAR